MDPVKLASGLPGHAAQLLARHPQNVSPGTQLIRPPPTTRTHDVSSYKAISPPVVSRGGAPYTYAPIVDGSHLAAGARYLQQPTYMTYQRDPHFQRSMSDRPLLMPQAPKRPSIMAGYGGYSREVMQMVASSAPSIAASYSDSNKRIKLNPPPKVETRIAPLVIDTTDSNRASTESSYYQPQTEAISPTLPPDPRDKSPLHTTRDDLMKQIEKVEKEISLIESSVVNLNDKEKELEAAATLKSDGKDAISTQESEENKDAKHQSAAQVIYAQNRKAAQKSHDSLCKLIPPSEKPRVLPLYHQPSDTESYQSNRLKYVTFKQHLIQYFKRKYEVKEKTDQKTTQTYSKLMNDWLKRVDKIENCKRYKEKLAKNRELFEKVFPELRKQREEKERFSRVGTRVKSDAEMEEIIDGLQDQENEEKKMRAYAVIPPIIVNERERNYRYINHNGRIEEPMTEYRDRRNINIWTALENGIFKEKYLQHPKNFVVVASCLDKKSVSDVIQHYYLTKKIENYKTLVKRRLRRPKKGGNQPDANSMLNGSTGVTTRNAAKGASSMLIGAKNSNSIQMCNDMGVVNPASSVVNWSTAFSSAPVLTLTTVSNTSSVSLSEASSMAPRPTLTISSNLFSEPGNLVEEPIANDLSHSVNSVNEKDKENLPNKCEKLSHRDRKANHDSSDEENSEQGRNVPHNCLTCNARLENFGQSRPISASQAGQYGLTEGSIPTGARICTNCHCRAIKRRLPQCSIGTCPTSKWRVKRLRPFPSRWPLLSPSVKGPIISELEIPTDATKSCSACHKKIVRKLGAYAEEPVDPSLWSEKDVEALKSALKELGCHWSKVAERLSKTQSQCKSFYLNFKDKHELDASLKEYRQTKGKMGPPTMTDEEESCSSSSCDETTTLPPPLMIQPASQLRKDSTSDTASASSPPPANADDQSKDSSSRDSIIKETQVNIQDNDSSATVSADESQNGAVGRESPEVQHIPHPNERKITTRNFASSGSRNSSPVVPGNNNSAPNIKQIIDNTIEETLAKSKNHKGLRAAQAPEQNFKVPQNKNHDHITIMTLLEHSTVPSTTGTIPVSQGPQTVTARSWPSPKTIYTREIGQVQVPQAAEMVVSQPVYENYEGGLDLTMKKRDRSPVRQHQSDSATITIKGGAEVIPTSVPINSPPRAHINSISYSNTAPPPDRYHHPDYRKPTVVPVLETRPSILPTTIGNTRVASPHYGTSQLPLSKVKAMAPPHSAPRVTLTHVPPNVPQSILGNRLPLKIDKLGVTQRGSITHGTAGNQHPVTMAGRYEIMTKPHLSREGSITQGTPIHHDPKRPSHASISAKEPTFMIDARSGVEIIPRPHLPSAYDRDLSKQRSPHRAPTANLPYSTTASYPPYTAYSYVRSIYSADSQITSRQIIENDYRTSKQMASRRDKDSRISPRAREQPSHDPRYSTVSTTLDRRNVERPVDHGRSEGAAGLDLREIRGSIAEDKSRKVQYVRTAHGYIPIHSGQPPQGSQLYISAADSRIARPSQSPITSRDATPPNPGTVSPHDFRSPISVSTPTPPPRLSSVIQRQPSSKLPLGHPLNATNAKSNSPRPENERYSPSVRHIGGGLEINQPLNMAEIIQHRQGYLSDSRRDSRANYPNPSQAHQDRHQLEGIGKQMVDNLQQNSRNYSHDQHSPAGSERELNDHERRYYERLEYVRVPRHGGKEEFTRVVPVGKKDPNVVEHQENVSKALNYHSPEQAKIIPAPINKPHRTADKYTAANLIEQIVNSHFVHGDPRDKDLRDYKVDTRVDGRVMYRREEVPHKLAPEQDKRVRSPGNIYPHKNKDLIQLDTEHHRHPHQKILSHSSQANPVSHPYSLSASFSEHVRTQQPLELTRSDRVERSDHRTIPGSHPSHYSSNAPQPVNLEKDPIPTSHSVNRPPSVSSSVLSHTSQNSPADERQIIPNAQLPSSAPSADNPIDYIKNKLREIWSENTSGPDNVSPDKRLRDKQSISRLTPVSHGQLSNLTRTRSLSSQEDESANKRPRLDSQNQDGPPARPRSDDVADSPQSGEMVIDENPQPNTLKPHSESPRDKTPTPTSQYSSPYPIYRSGGNGQVPITKRTNWNPPVSSNSKPQSYDPVSDVD